MGWIAPKPTVAVNWSSCLQTFAFIGQGWMTFLAFSSDGSKLVYGDSEQRIEMRDVATGTLMMSLEPPHSRSRLCSAAISSGSGRIAIGERGGTLKILDLTTGLCEYVLEGHSSAVTSMAFFNSGTRSNEDQLASGSSDGIINIWDVATRTLRFTLECHYAEVTSLQFSNIEHSGAAPRLASSSMDGTAKIWDPERGALQYTLEQALQREAREPIQRGLRTAVFSSDGMKLASISNDRVCTVWSTITGDMVYSFGNLSKSDGAGSIAFLGGDCEIAISNPLHESGYEILDLKTGKASYVFESGMSHVSSIAFSSKTMHLASASNRGEIKIWDMETTARRQEQPFRCNALSTPPSLRFSGDGLWLASIVRHGTIKIWHVETGKLQCVLKYPTSDSDPGRAPSIAFSSDGKMLAGDIYGRQAMIWNPSTGKTEHVFDDPTFLPGQSPTGCSPVPPIALSTDGRLAKVLYNGTLIILNVMTEDWEELDHSVPYETTSVSFSADNRWLAAGSKRGTINVWDTTAEELGYTTTLHYSGPGDSDFIDSGNAVISLAFSRDGTRLASYSRAYYLGVWDATTWTLCTVIQYVGEIGNLMFDVFSSHLLIGHTKLQLEPNVEEASRLLSYPRDLGVVMGNWIAWGGHAVIWHPVGRGSRTTAISPANFIIALGCEAHGIDIMGFPDEGPPNLQRAQLEDEQKGHGIYDVLEAPESPEPLPRTLEDFNKEAFRRFRGLESHRVLFRRK